MAKKNLNKELTKIAKKTSVHLKLLKTEWMIHWIL